VRDFYAPAYAAADEYCRAVGYFTSTSMALMTRGLDDFVTRGGRVRVVASPRLELDDINDIERGYEVREVFARATMRVLEGERDEGLLRGLGVVGRLIAAGSLDIKLAFFHARDRMGLYHEKIGYFKDPLGDVVAFSGSSNETYGGLIANFESVEVYRSWAPGDGDRALRIMEDFNDLWEDRTQHLEIIPFPDVVRERLIELSREYGAKPLPARDDALAERAATTQPRVGLRLPPALQSRTYQSDAIRSWLERGGRGIFKMATGTGKTKTALMAATHVAQVHARREEPLVVIVVVPYQHLVDQWIEEIEAFGVQPIAVYESSARWIPRVEDALAALRFGSATVAVMVVTNASFALQRFQSVLGRISTPLLLIGDEVHNLGSRKFAALLPSNATYRLGLSATPERFMDPVGTDALIEYFGPVAFEIDLSAAIDLGALCHYDYFPRLVELDEDEMVLYLALTAQIAPLLASVDSLDDAVSDSPLGLLLRKRSAVLGHASGKLGMLTTDIARHRNDWFQLVYCAEGRRPSADGLVQLGNRQIEDALELVSVDFGMSAHTYVSSTPREERRALLRRFQRGDDLRVLIAMRCLDEGVDIPDARIGYVLASSSNPRQFIQRRGRLLRQSPTGAKRAVIYDYLAVPQEGNHSVVQDTERNLVRRELERALEFGKMSDNYAATLTALRPLKERYGLMDL
jgi:superfamily II DNA or RNA helicase